MTTLPPDGMHAGWIDSPDGALFVAYHAPQGDVTRDVAILFCDPFGSDRMNLHAAYRELALRLSATGFPVLRVDYAGTCDSSGYPREKARVATWLDNLDTAADWLRRTSGKSQICLFGALLGGTFALVMAGRRNDVSGLVLWGAFPTGRAYMREVAAFEEMTPSNPDRRRESSWQAGDHEAAGLLLPRAMAEELMALTLPPAATPNVKWAAVYRRNESANVTVIVRHLEQGGALVEVPERAIGDIAVLGKRPLPPLTLFDHIVEWCCKTYAPSSSVADAAPEALQLSQRVELDSAGGSNVVESVVRFGDDAGLFGVLTQDAQSSVRGDVALVLVSAGWNHRVGINRNYTTWARDAAAAGFSVLRFDVRGLGDSIPHHVEDLGVLYRDETCEDVIVALDFLKQRLGVRRFVCVGLCAGAYQVLHAGLADPRIVGLVLLNQARFFPISSDGHGPDSFRHPPLAHYARAWRDPAHWRRFLAGEKTRSLEVVLSVTKRLTRITAARLAKITGQVQATGFTRLADVFLRLTRRGTNLLIVYDMHDPIFERFVEDIGQDRSRLEATGRFLVVKMDNTDHIFAPLWSQEAVGNLLHRTLVRWTENAPPPSTRR